MQTKVASATHPLRENTLSTRLKLLLLAETKERGRYAELEVASGIPAATWRTWWTRGGAPGGLLIEAVAKRWPQFAYWLVTGRTDVRCGHDMPALAPEARGYISNWPEEASQRSKLIKTGYSREYLKLSVQVSDAGSNGDVTEVMRTEALIVAANRRRDEISKNFDVPLAIEELQELAFGNQVSANGDQ